MITEKEGESRSAYLVRVAVEYIRENADFNIDYDETTCDGYCLAEELAEAHGLESNF